MPLSEDKAESKSTTNCSKAVRSCKHEKSAVSMSEDWVPRSCHADLNVIKIHLKIYRNLLCYMWISYLLICDIEEYIQIKSHVHTQSISKMVNKAKNSTTLISMSAFLQLALREAVRLLASSLKIWLKLKTLISCSYRVISLFWLHIDYIYYPSCLCFCI